MKVFISWSGKTSHAVAIALRDWLPSVIQSINPYVSSEDIDKGARWSSDIAGELDESSFGILCVTEDNVNAPWLNFEAGALGKSVERSRVCPFLFRIKPSDIDGPLLQYQSTIYNEKDIYKLLLSINNAYNENKIDEKRLEKIFEVWWPILNESLEEIKIPKKQKISKQETVENGEDKKYLSKVLEEVLEISRTNQRLLRDPETILPIGYFEHIMHKVSSHERDILNRHQRRINFDIEPAAIEELITHYRGLLKFISRQKKSLGENIEMDEMFYLLERMDKPLRYISKEMGFRLPKDIFENSLL